MGNLTPTPHLDTSSLGTYNPTMVFSNTSKQIYFPFLNISNHKSIGWAKFQRMIPTHSHNKILLSNYYYAKQQAKCLHKGKENVMAPALMGLMVIARDNIHTKKV